ncbi:MAG TPA: 2Fe-2S iron-sulfur cluster binding domain-containing protein [Thermotogota bacterium]|jgi:Na+-transporting NADH:ubiquinone oxidoreductase subunit F|nr:2Fe-2S iron-sulfur cluster binding domain-containing protein [Thermotogota bacterium]NLH19120.1 2Fe-2S iron-sulfur cluster binding domain-containing protein [Thermotogaceae bacterium]OQC30981.1 MAG: Na(+)-translocating NADH-quinone reductase subunit F [Thermotogota bacterium ADurb.Bin062]HNW45903.1 2Fe-2S iron-sulfur cluster binding domain-containing protein [Thermotogota bacterium]HNY81873.1 2Fe-2S iron-sulfur cluster binding domain-containing protein [Thermotogota bacterium]
MWTAPIIISAISAVLAFAIAIIDGIVNNYADVTISINEGQKTLSVKGGSPLLSSLATKGVFVPSACGGKGSCGACKVKVLSDIGPHLPTELPFMSPEEIKDNIRLSCQVKLKSDIRIRLPEELFSVRQLNCTVESLKDVTYDIKELRIRLPKNATIDFKAGQYLQLVIPPYQEIKESAQRAYSISSKPSDKNSLEFLIRLVPNGIATTYVHRELKEKQPISVIGPFGDFCLRDTDADMFCVAGGSGMAPIRSILLDMYEKKINHRTVWYFFGARSRRDLFYLNEFRELERLWPCFHFVPALSEPLPDDRWEGETGLITQVLDTYMKKNPDPSKSKEGYLCGSPGMINACVKVMIANGIPENEIYFDKFA